MALPKGTTTREPVVSKPGPAVKRDAHESLKPQPVPALQKVGFHGTMRDFNERVQAVHDAHERTQGYRPTPGLTLVAAKSQVPTPELPKLFDIPRTKAAAKSWSFFKETNGVIETTNPLDGAAAQTVAPEPVEQDELDRVVYLGVDPAEAAEAKAFKSKSHEEKRAWLMSLEGRSLHQRMALLRLAGRAPKGVKQGRTEIVMNAGFGGEDIASFVFRASTQIFGGLALGIPTLAVAEGKAVKRSIEQRSLDPFVDTNVELGKGIGTALYEEGRAIVTGDWEYLSQNPGFVVLDLMGVGQIAGKAGKAAARTMGKEVPTRKTVRLGGLEKEALLSDSNPLAAYEQAKSLERRQRAADARHGAEPGEPGAKVPGGRGTLAGKFFRRHFSFERKVGRLRERERRLNLAVATQIIRDLENVAGWSPAIHNVAKILPKRARGLTVGENMALMIESLDVPGHVTARIDALRGHHERMYAYGPEPFQQRLGYIPPSNWAAEHGARLDAIKLAEDILLDPARQSPRFKKALELVRRASDENTLRKIEEFGLSPLTADRRVGKLGALIEGRVDDFDDLADATRRRDESFYVPSQSRAQAKTKAKEPYRGTRLGPHGIPAVDLNRLLPELKHEFKGDHFVRGNYRFDVANLLAENIGNTLRAIMYRKDHEEAWAAALPAPPKGETDFYVPIRDIKDAPEELREIMAKVDQGELTQREADLLGNSKSVENMLAFLYPGRKVNGRWVDLPDDAHVKWVDQRLLPVEAYKQPMPTGWSGFFHVVNAPLVLLRVFLRPAYLLNLGGNAVMNAIDGSFSIPNVARSLKRRDIYGDRAADTIEALVGQGRSMSYAVEGENALSKTSRLVARAASRVTDTDLRVTAFIHHARKKGRLQGNAAAQRADMDDLLFGDAPETVALRNEIAQRAKQAMAELDNLTWMEKNVFRQLIFVYPWTSRSTVWSVRSIIDHPVKADILAHIPGASEEDDEFFGKALGWMKRSGWVPFYTDDEGNPVAGGLGFLSPYTSVTSLLHGDVEEFAGPTAELFLRVGTGKDELGREYDENEWMSRAKAVLDVYSNIPAVQAHLRGERKDEPLPPLDLSNEKTLVNRLNAAMEQQVLSPGFWNGWGVFFAGGLTPRTVNKRAMSARWYADLPTEKKHEVQMSLIRHAVKLQGKILGTEPPAAVLEAVNREGRLTLREAQWKDENPGEKVTPRMRAGWMLDLLRAENVTDDATDKKLRAEYKTLVTAEEYESFKARVMKENGGQAFVDWNRDINLAWLVSHPKLLERNLRAAGFTGTTKGMKREQLYPLARAAVAYAREADKREDAAWQVTDPNLRDLAFTELSVWEDEQDKPVVVNGRTFPSAARVEWAFMSQERRDETLARLAVRRSWDTLSALEKELLGKPIKKELTAAWALYQEALATYKQERPFNERTLTADQRLGTAKAVNRQYPGFIGDWAHAQKPLFERLKDTKLIQQSPNRSDWAWLFDGARQLHASGHPKSHVQELWADYIRQTRPWIESNLPGLAAEIERYEQFRPTFLTDLVKR